MARVVGSVAFSRGAQLHRLQRGSPVQGAGRGVQEVGVGTGHRLLFGWGGREQAEGLRD